jgi:hypothetical protein
VIDIADAVYLVNYLYKSGPAPDPQQAGDVNCDAGCELADVVFLLNFLYKSGPPPEC